MSIEEGHGDAVSGDFAVTIMASGCLPSKVSRCLFEELLRIQRGEELDVVTGECPSSSSVKIALLGRDNTLNLEKEDASRTDCVRSCQCG